MKIARHAQNRIWARLAAHQRRRQLRQHLVQMKPAVEAVSGLGQIAPCIFGLSHGVVGAADGAFDVAKHDVHPAPAWCANALRPQDGGGRPGRLSKPRIPAQGAARSSLPAMRCRRL